MIYGLTIDDVSKLPAICEALAAMPVKPYVRVVNDEGVSPFYYLKPYQEISKHAFIVSEVLDSFYMPDVSVTEYRERCRIYFDTLAPWVDTWEVGNEVNGDWLGIRAREKVVAGHRLAKERGLKTMITGYLDEYKEGHENNMFTWIERGLPKDVLDSCDYASVSFYEDDNNFMKPNWAQVFNRLGEIFPRSTLLIGECGTKRGKPFSRFELPSTVQRRKLNYMQRYYSMRVDHPRFQGGYFWWYGKQDLVPRNKPLHAVFCSLIAR